MAAGRMSPSRARSSLSMATPAFRASPGDRGLKRSPDKVMVPALEGTAPKIPRASSERPAPDESEDAHDLPTAKLKIDRLEAWPTETVEGQERFDRRP